MNHIFNIAKEAFKQGEINWDDALFVTFQGADIELLDDDARCITQGNPWTEYGISRGALAGEGETSTFTVQMRWT